MTTSEKRLFYIAGFFFIIYMLPFYIAPKVYNVYEDYNQNIETLESNIKKYEKLNQQTEEIKAEYQHLTTIVAEIESGLLTGQTRQLIGTNLRSLVTKLAKDVGITMVKSLPPPDTSFATDEWLFVIQSMQFEASSATLIDFLQAITDNDKKLEIIHVNVRSRNNKLTGKIEIGGFSYAPQNIIQELTGENVI